MIAKWRTLMVGSIRRSVRHRFLGRGSYFVIAAVVSVVLSLLFVLGSVNMVEAGRHRGRYVKCILAA
jgi:hypothetical protein